MKKHEHEHEQLKLAAFSAVAKEFFQKSLEDFKAGCIRVLVMAGRELMFFIEAYMGLYLGFVPKTCWQHRDILATSE